MRRLHLWGGGGWEALTWPGGPVTCPWALQLLCEGNDWTGVWRGNVAEGHVSEKDLCRMGVLASAPQLGVLDVARSVGTSRFLSGGLVPNS